MNNTDVDPCRFECGSFNGYECLEPGIDECDVCSADYGECRGMENCLRDIKDDKGNEEDFIIDTRKIFQMLNSCIAIDWSMGNFRTINLYCGQDPFYEVIHDEIYKTLHFTGCGLTQDQCTFRPCCDDMVRYL